jgi:hypothetical protein
MKLGWPPRKWLDKRSKLGFRGYSVGTVAFYGPDDRHASKVAVAVIVSPDTEPVALRRCSLRAAISGTMQHSRKLPCFFEAMRCTRWR